MPFAAGVHINPTGIFKIFTMDEPYPDVAYTETVAGRIYVEEPATERFVTTYNRLQSMSFSPDESAELISAMAQKIE